MNKRTRGRHLQERERGDCKAKKEMERSIQLVQPFKTKGWEGGCRGSAGEIAGVRLNPGEAYMHKHGLYRTRG